MRFWYFTALLSNEASASLLKLTDCQILHCSHAQSMDVDEDLDQNLDL